MVFILRDSGIWYSTFAAYRDPSQEGQGKGEEREKRLPCDPESETLQGVRNCCAKTRRRAYHVTPDLRWHGQQLHYSSLKISDGDFLRKKCRSNISKDCPTKDNLDIFGNLGKKRQSQSRSQSWSSWLLKNSGFDLAPDFCFVSMLYTRT